jgi:quinohemoprotein ethanol dehydrogenase
VLATAGGLVFQGDANGFLNAYDSDSGRKLVAVQLGSSMMAAPMTYRVHGIQYLAIMAGYGGGAVIVGAPFDPASAAYKYGNDGRIIVLRLGGPRPPLPKLQDTDGPPPDPPPHSGSPAQIATGEILYNRYCMRCHASGRGMLPDLRRISSVTHSMFRSIVLDGVYAPKGMGRFDDVLSPTDLEALHDYIIDQAWLLKGASTTPAAKDRGATGATTPAG